MSQLYLELYSICDNIVQVPVKTAVCLFNFIYLNSPSCINLNFVLTQVTKPYLNINIQTLNYQLLSYDILEPPVNSCCLPIFTPADNSCCVAGLCSVLRQVCIMHHFVYILVILYFIWIQVNYFFKF